MRKCIYIFTEDELSLSIAEKLAQKVGFYIAHSQQTSGKSRLKKNIVKYNELARRHPVLLLTDLDMDACAPALLSEWMGNRPISANLSLRVCVHECEAWLMGDAATFAEYLQVPVNTIPDKPEIIRDPKEALFKLIRRKSRLREIKAGLLPGYGARLGSEYNSLLTSYVEKYFRFEAARERCNSLDRAIRALTYLYNRFEPQ